MTTTAKVDNKLRVRIPWAKAGDLVTVQSLPDGSWSVSPVKEPTQIKEAFPPGSLLKYITPEYNQEQE